MEPLRYYLMSISCEFSVNRRIETAEESARIAWRSYHAHFNLSRLDPEWEQQAWILYKRCKASDAQVSELKGTRTRAIGYQGQCYQRAA